VFADVRPETINMGFSAPGEVSPGEVVELQVVVTDDAGRPVSGLSLLVDGMEPSEPTSEDGTVVVTLEVPDPISKQVWSVRLDSPETDRYAGSTSTVFADVKRGLQPWIYLVILTVGLLGTSGGAAAVWFVARRNPAFLSKIVYRDRPAVSAGADPPLSQDPGLLPSDHTVIDDTAGDLEFSDDEAVPAEPAEPKLPKTLISLTLVRDVDDAPEYIGIGETFSVSAKLVDEEGSSLQGLPVTVEIDGHGSWDQDTDKGGSFFVELDAAEPGEHRIIASFEGNAEFAGSDDTITVWVLEYRDAITDIYNGFAAQVKESGIELDPQATPREVERSVVTAGSGVDEILLDDLVSVFEEADYSLHEIIRADFLRARRAVDGLEIGPSGIEIEQIYDSQTVSQDPDASEAIEDE
jgi:hypothetical protein